MKRIQDLIGREVELDAANRALRDFAQSQRAAVVGAVHVTCSDESEREASESFQRWFVDSLLPELKFSSRSAFRSANLGGRYEWGAVRIAEEHYATASTRDAFKVMLVKINAHVAAHESGGVTRFGNMNRYDTDSACCGALNAMLAGTRHPAMDELHMAFAYDGLPRIDMLRDENTVPEHLRAFTAAVVSSRLQARSAIVDIQDYVPQTPTVTVVVPTVTINRPQRDTEFVVGIYWADSRKRIGEAEYVGLGDDPSAFAYQHRHNNLVVEDKHLEQPREARDHREEVVTQWKARHPEFQTVSDRRLADFAEKTKDPSSYSSKMANETLKTLLWLAADISPIPLSIMLFAKGLAGVHHLYRAHRLARGVDGNEQAREIIEEVTDQINKIPVERARETIQTIMAHYRPET